VNVTPQSVRDRINISEAQCSDAIVNQFITDAVATIEVETDLSIDPANCREIEAVAIRNLAAIYCACRITGGTASGLSFRVGDLAVNESSNNSPSGLSTSNLQFLMNEATRILENLKTPYVGLI
jgi:hypothetical protein